MNSCLLTQLFVKHKICLLFVSFYVRHVFQISNISSCSTIINQVSPCDNANGMWAGDDKLHTTFSLTGLRRHTNIKKQYIKLTGNT